MSDEPAQPQTLRELFSAASAKRTTLESAPSSVTEAYQDTLLATITAYEDCERLADRVSLFSANESLDDVASADLPYFLLHYYIAELVLKITSTGPDVHVQRKKNVKRAQASYVDFLKRLDGYDMLESRDVKQFERYREDPLQFSTASTTDAAARRETKINRFRQEKELKQKLEVSKFLAAKPRSIDLSSTYTSVYFLITQSIHYVYTQGLKQDITTVIYLSHIADTSFSTYEKTPKPWRKMIRHYAICS
jgi:hypothetical protein